MRLFEIIATLLSCRENNGPDVNLLHRAEFYCLSRHILAVLSFSMRGIIITNISCRNSDCSCQ